MARRIEGHATEIISEELVQKGIANLKHHKSQDQSGMSGELVKQLGNSDEIVSKITKL